MSSLGAHQASARRDEEKALSTALLGGEGGEGSPGHLSMGHSPANPARLSPAEDMASSQSINSSKSGGAKRSGSGATPSRDRKAWVPPRQTLLGNKMRYYSALRSQAAASPSPRALGSPGVRGLRGRADSFLAPPESVIPPTCELAGWGGTAALPQRPTHAPRSHRSVWPA